jgi:hypothetical protein
MEWALSGLEGLNMCNALHTLARSHLKKSSHCQKMTLICRAKLVFEQIVKSAGMERYVRVIRRKGASRARFRPSIANSDVGS